ncbi:MAG TPA: DedA family protein [Acidimicrobiales bacterium]|jgi:membrane protein DedA with SNARE-associated domain|nr:DedA family protein [Acidimicrobiales bacterium]
MIAHLLNPILNLHGWEAYLLVGVLVFAEASVMLGFIFPGETAVILGGVVASRGHVNIFALIVVVVLCAIVGDTVGYAVGEKWGRRLLDTRFLRKRQRLLDRVLQELNRRGAIAVFLARFTAFLRAVVPGLAGVSAMRYRTFLPANAAGGLVWGTAFCLLGYFVGSAYTKVESASGTASDVLLGLLVVVIVVLSVRRRRKEKAELAEAGPSVETGPMPGAPPTPGEPT